MTTACTAVQTAASTASPACAPRCSAARSTLGLKWFDEEIDDVTAYLNKTFYQFK